jgi:type III secretory pathway component EscU
MKQVIENFKKPTPLKWRKVGYILLTFSASLAGYVQNFTEFTYKNILTGAVIVSGILGKLITDCFTDEK